MNRLSSVAHTIAVEAWAVKALLAGIFATVSRLFAVKADLLFLVVVLVILDTVSGMIAAKMRNEAITSFGMRRMLVKLVEYFVVIGAAIILSNVAAASSGYISTGLSWLAEFVVFWISVTEFKSILENVGPVGLFDAVKDRLSSLVPPKKDE